MASPEILSSQKTITGVLYKYSCSVKRTKGTSESRNSGVARQILFASGPFTTRLEGNWETGFLAPLLPPLPRILLREHVLGRPEFSYDGGE